MKILTRFLQDKSGATAIEYALIVAMIFLVIVTAIGIYAQHTNTLYQKIGDAVNNAG